MENKWIKQGGNFKAVPSSISVEDNLPTAIYSINRNPMSGELSLNYVAKRFEFDFEVLGLEKEFIEHALKSYEDTTGNFGVLLNGVKGTGKTVTAKVLANTLNKPVILVDTAYDGIDTFIASLNFECVLFFDEFEKNFDPDKDINILTIMDGVYNCCERKVFILTTNETRINQCLLSRPSRIRYKKEFTNISSEVINYLMDKYLKDQSMREELFNFVTILEVCSVDIIKALITEVNIHGKEKFPYIKEIFNVKANPVFYNILMVDENFWDDNRSETVTYSRTEALKTLQTLIALHNIEHRNEEENALYYRLRYKGCGYDTSVRFPCRFWDLKKGMFLMGMPIIEINEDARIAVVKNTDNSLRYIYVCPANVYNAYQGNLAI